MLDHKGKRGHTGMLYALLSKRLQQEFTID